jgi:hypothetical protein
MRVRSFVPAALLAAAAGCGYQVGQLHRVDDVAVPIFENSSDRRINEFDLTEAVAREMQVNGITVNPPQARYRLEGEIDTIEQPRVAEDRVSTVTVSSFSVVVRVTLKDAQTGQTVRGPSAKRFTAPFAPGRGQTADSARAQAFDAAAKWVVEQLEESW